jgi:hypothetical protein
MTAEIVNEVDNLGSQEHVLLEQKVNHFCTQLEELIAEWKLEELMRSNSVPVNLRYLIADHVMNIYAIVIGIQRLLRKVGTSSQTVDGMTLRAARKVTRITLEFSVGAEQGEPAYFGCIQYVSTCFFSSYRNRLSDALYFSFISFYPFCAVFSLYEYILACSDPDDCEEDVQVLERIGSAMAEISAERADFIPFEKTIDALNKVSRSIQDERRKLQMSESITGENAAMPEFDASAFASFPDFPFNFDDRAQPHGFVRALETDFMARNWSEGWWDVGAGLDVPMMAGVPEA